MMDNTQLTQIVDAGMTAIFQAYQMGNFTAAIAARDAMIANIQALCSQTHETPPQE